MSTPEPKRTPLGPALNWTDEEMDAMSVITEADAQRAKASVPPAMRRLLDAETVEDDE